MKKIRFEFPPFPPMHGCGCHPHDHFPHIKPKKDVDEAAFVHDANIVKDAECVHEAQNVENATSVKSAVNVTTTVTVDQYIDENLASENPVANKTIAEAVTLGTYIKNGQSVDTFAPTITSGSKKAVQGGAIYTALAGKVNVEEGKSLSTNDYTNDDKAIVDGVTSALEGKVDIEEGKGLSTNDYTNDDKAIVDGVTTALEGKVDVVEGKGLSTNDYTNDDKAIVGGVTTALAGKVDAEEGKGLSSNDFTNADKAVTTMIAGATVPTTDGTYVLKATVSSGVVTLSWVSE